MRPVWKAVVFPTGLVVSVVGVLEVMLRLLSAASARVDRLLAPRFTTPGWSATIPDVQLGYRLNPRYPGLDRNGFSNPSVPRSAQTAVLGDSQTYPTGVEPWQAWPRQLESLTHQTVYSLAVGGYGPVHSLILWEEAAALHPATVIEALYAGNDLFDAFDLVYNRGQHPELRSPDSALQHQVRQAELGESIADRVARIYGEARPAVIRPASAAQRVWFSAREFLGRHSKLYGLLNRSVFEASRRRAGDPWRSDSAAAAAHPEYLQAFRRGAFRTVFTPELRLSVLDLDDPRVAEGQRITLRVIDRMHERAVASGVRLIVALIPTKELVFSELWTTPSASFRALTRNETRFWQSTKAYLDERGIEYADVLSAMRASLAAGRQPYHVSRDGHPNQWGHREIAKLIAEKLRRPHPAE